MDGEIRNIVHMAVRALYQEQKKLLEDLYVLPAKDLEDQEKHTLTGQAINLTAAAQKKMVEALKKAEVPYFYSVWQGIYERLPEISFIYIDWDSFRSAEHVSGHRNDAHLKSEGSGKKGLKRKPAVAAGGAAAGSLILVWLTPAGSVLGPVGSAALIGAAAVGAYIGVRAMDANKLTPSEKNNSSEKKSLSQLRREAIATAEKTNIMHLKQWCETLEKITLERLEAAEG